jgi:hypothetical protein
VLEQVDPSRKRASSHAASLDSSQIPSTAESSPNDTLEAGVESSPDSVASELLPTGSSSSLLRGKRTESPESPAAILQLASSDDSRATPPGSGQESHNAPPIASSDFGQHYSAAGSSAHLQMPSFPASGRTRPWEVQTMTLNKYEALPPARRGEVLTNGHRPRKNASTASGLRSGRGSSQQQPPLSLIESMMAVIPRMTLNYQTRAQMADTRTQQPRGAMSGSEKMSAMLGSWVQRGKKGRY